jgi:DNA repair protein RadC
MPTLNLENVYHVTEVALTYKNKIPASHRLKITNSKDAYNILYGSWDHNRIDLLEQFKILLVKGNYCLGISELSTGGTAMCPADPKLVMATALMANAAAIILAHNHPSGNLNASRYLTYREDV